MACKTSPIFSYRTLSHKYCDLHGRFLKFNFVSGHNKQVQVTISRLNLFCSKEHFLAESVGGYFFLIATFISSIQSQFFTSCLPSFSIPTLLLRLQTTLSLCPLIYLLSTTHPALSFFVPCSLSFSHGVRNKLSHGLLNFTETSRCVYYDNK